MSTYTDVTGHQVDQYFINRQVLDRIEQAQNGGSQ
jgi:hypothetical protein